MGQLDTNDNNTIHPPAFFLTFDNTSARQPHHKFDPECFLDPKTSWKHLDLKTKEASIAKMDGLCRRSDVHCEGGNLAEWRVYNLHRTSTKVKPKEQDTSTTGI